MMFFFKPAFRGKLLVGRCSAEGRFWKAEACTISEDDGDDDGGWRTEEEEEEDDDDDDDGDDCCYYHHYHYCYHYCHYDHYILLVMNSVRYHVFFSEALNNIHPHLHTITLQ